MVCKVQLVIHLLSFTAMSESTWWKRMVVTRLVVVEARVMARVECCWTESTLFSLPRAGGAGIISPRPGMDLAVMMAGMIAVIVSMLLPFSLGTVERVAGRSYLY